MCQQSLVYVPPHPGSEVREPILLQFLDTHVEKIHLNENCGFGDEYKASFLSCKRT